jgi:transposase
MTFAYYRMTMEKSQAKFGLRIAMVKHALKHGVSAAAREYNTTRKTARKWLNRWRETNSVAALEDRSRAPRRIPHKTPPATERRIVAIRRRFPRWGPERLKMHFDLKPSVSAIARVIRQHKLVRKRQKKWKRKRDLRQAKKRWKPLEKWQFDVKYLTDIPRYVKHMYRHRLPRYQYTARDVRTGAHFFAYGDAWTNMLQPFWALPLLGIMGLRAKDIIGYTAMVFLLMLLTVFSFVGLGILITAFMDKEETATMVMMTVMFC